MKELTTLALSKAINSSEYKKNRAGLGSGLYEINTTVRLKGKLTVGKDSLKKATCSVLNQEFLMLVLHHAGITRDSAVNILSSLSEEYLKNWHGTDEDKKSAKAKREEMIESFDPDGKIQSVFDSLKEKLPKIKVEGKVSFDGIAEELEVSETETEIEFVEVNSDISNVA